MRPAINSTQTQTKREALSIEGMRAAPRRDSRIEESNIWKLG
jgi:hypothetical protein